MLHCWASVLLGVIFYLSIKKKMKGLSAYLVQLSEPCNYSHAVKQGFDNMTQDLEHTNTFLR